MNRPSVRPSKNVLINWLCKLTLNQVLQWNQWGAWYYCFHISGMFFLFCFYWLKTQVFWYNDLSTCIATRVEDCSQDMELYPIFRGYASNIRSYIWFLVILGVLHPLLHPLTGLTTKKLCVSSFNLILFK